MYFLHNKIKIEPNNTPYLNVISLAKKLLDFYSLFFPSLPKLSLIVVSPS